MWAGTIKEFRICVGQCNNNNFKHTGFNYKDWLYGKEPDNNKFANEYCSNYKTSWNDLANTIDEKFNSCLWLICEQHVIDNNQAERNIDFTLVGFKNDGENGEWIKKFLMLEHKYTTASLGEDIENDIKKLNSVKDALEYKSWLKQESGRNGYQLCNLSSPNWYFHQPSCYIYNENTKMRNLTENNQTSLATNNPTGWLSKLSDQFSVNDIKFTRCDLLSLSKNLFSVKTDWV